MTRPDHHRTPESPTPEQHGDHPDTHSGATDHGDKHSDGGGHDHHHAPFHYGSPDHDPAHRDEHAGHHGDHGQAGQHHAGHEDHGGHAGHGDHVGQFRRLFWIMLVLAVPVVGFNDMFADLLGYQLPDAGWVWWVSPILGTVMYVWGGRPFLTGAVSELRARQPGMMLLIGLAITVAFIASWGASLRILDHELNFWWELALLVVIMLLGHWIEMRSLAQTTSALDSLAALLPDEAEKIDGDDVVTVAPADLAVGDIVIVRPGASVPADGRITDGSASMDESMVTGESKSVRRETGEQVVAGTVATDSGLRIEVTAIGEDTALAGIQKLVTDAQASSSRAQRIADTAAAWLFWFAIGAAAITAVIWSFLGMPDTAVVRTITVLVIACPHALGLAIPLVVSIATERAARGGVLVKDRLALESMRTVDTVLFDKTGTLTKGEPNVTGIEPIEGHTEDEVLALAAAAESDSEHPLARAVVGAARARELAVAEATDFSSSPAVGVRARVDGTVVEVGGPHLLDQRGLDELTVAAELGIDRVFAGVRPEDKAAMVAELQGECRKVAMVGDGVNDAPALAQADVGIAIGAGTDVAIGSAGVILASSDPRSVLSVIDLSRASYRKMKQNLWWAAGYNLISVPLAAGVLAPIGFVLPMSVGAILMSASTVVVALNAQLLRRLDLTPAHSTSRFLDRDTSG
ncbi:HAD-IC family P-type ATPase [Kocuria carniphila]|nr:HAD-IC family P-type ATPase [Kocuria carniphila]MCT1802758.1 HAD-IC family P-type ATPase [Kocuria carniphila]